MKLGNALLRREVARRRNLRLENIAATLRGELFGLQQEVWDCESRYIRLGVGRRGGKTKFLTRRVLHAALTFRMPVRYSGERGVIPVHFPSLTMQGAKDFWINLLQLADHKGLVKGVDYHAQQQEKTLTILSNGNQIQLRSLANIAEADKARGGKYPQSFVDEAQSVPDEVLDYLIKESLGPALRDLDGQFIMSGTEARVHAGIWHESRYNKQYAHFSWWMGDNPTLEGDSDAWVREFCRNNNVSVDDSFIQREYYNRPAVDLGALVYPFEKDRNTAPVQLPEPKVRVGGVDLGYQCATARVLCDYSYLPDRGWCYILSDVDYITQSSPSAIGVWLAPWLTSKHADVTVVDSNGGGKLAAEELIQSQGLPLTPAASRRDKRAWQSEMASYLRSGKLLIHKASADNWIQQAAKLERDPATGKELDGPPRDILDAALYAFHQCKQLSSDDALTSPSDDFQAWELEDQDDSGLNL